MSRTAQKPGNVFRIRLADGSFAYAMTLEDPYTGFYDYCTQTPVADVREIASQPIVFKLAVEGNVVRRWDVVGRHAVEGDAATPVVQFMQDIGDHRRCVIFDSVGNERGATPEECLGLERAVVWRPEHVEQRLLDRFSGRPNRNEERYRPRLK